MFNYKFSSIVKELNIPIDQDLSNGASTFDDRIIEAVHKYKRHSNILKIKEKVKIRDAFPYFHVNLNEIFKILQNVDSKKAT